MKNIKICNYLKHKFILFSFSFRLCLGFKTVFFRNFLGGEIVSTFDNPEMVKIGRCDVIEQVQIGDETLLKFSGVPLGEACSIVLRGATEQIIGEAERSLHDALCVLTSTVKETKTVFGGGKP